MALSKLQDKDGQTDPDMARFASYFALYLGEWLTEIAQDAEGTGYPRPGHALWGGDEE
jgi:hypothetical protein